MKHILTCSFGKDSIATALLALQHGEPLDELVYSEVMFSDTVSGELPEHKRFIYETAIPYFEKRGITPLVRSLKTVHRTVFFNARALLEFKSREYRKRNNRNRLFLFYGAKDGT